MRAYWCRVVVLGLSALAACSDPKSRDVGELRIDAAVCAGEQARLFVDDALAFAGSARDAVAKPVPVEAGEHEVRLWIGVKLVLDQTLRITAGQTSTLSAMRKVVCREPDASGGQDAGQSAFEACSSQDNLSEDARALGVGRLDDALCDEGDVDFFHFDVAGDRLVRIALSTADITSDLSGQITLFDAEGHQLDQQVQHDGEDAKVSFLLFGGERYLLRVADLAGPSSPPDGGVDGGSGFGPRPYQITLSFQNASPTTEATVGTFHGATNAESVPGLEGSFVAASVHTAKNKPVDYKVLMRTRFAGAPTQQLVYDPDLATDGVLKVVFYDGTEPVQKRVSRRSASVEVRALRWRGWYGLANIQPVYLKEAFTGQVSIAFPNGTLKRSLDVNKELALPAITAAAPSADLTRVTVKMKRPTGATAVAVEAFGATSGATGHAEPKSASFDVDLTAPLADAEAFVLRVRAADNGLLSLPLPESTNLSELIYYSDKSASQE